ncbi:hypothetical protein [Falsiroseomonas selenitidurans]|uniref:Hypervirulence associated protein TUDOR domain-containing protein n=1 Tax=Falsiroseomonas selenitidurans TaxID=2716335 RepID=A0ABX1EC72_9PROT|nr:hypothetical protein [Falsiroseomonas selenitidurans]NKC33097.1 hypothetical protein [Falsiroseomonas selenitidurans]
MPPKHRYTVGQHIEFVPGRYDGSAPPGAYTVVRQLPNDAADREYRVKNSRDGHERIIRESQMRQSAAVFG